MTEPNEEKLILTGHDLLDLPEIEWLWPGYIPLGLPTAVIGQAGSGKSAFVQDLAFRLSAKSEWPDGTPIISKSKTLWIDAEGAKPILAERVRNWGMPPDDFILPFQADIYADFTLSDRTNKQIEKILKEEKPLLVVLDSLTGIHNVDEKDAQKIKLVMDPLKFWASHYQCAVVLVHHSNKKNPLDKAFDLTIDRLRGSSHIAAAVRSVIAIDQVATRR